MMTVHCGDSTPGNIWSGEPLSQPFVLGESFTERLRQASVPEQGDIVQVYPW